MYIAIFAHDSTFTGHNTTPVQVQQCSLGTGKCSSAVWVQASDASIAVQLHSDKHNINVV